MKTDRIQRMKQALRRWLFLRMIYRILLREETAGVATTHARIEFGRKWYRSKWSERRKWQVFHARCIDCINRGWLEEKEVEDELRVKANTLFQTTDGRTNEDIDGLLREVLPLLSPIWRFVTEASFVALLIGLYKLAKWGAPLLWHILRVHL